MGNIWELSLYATEVMYKVSDTDYKGEWEIIVDSVYGVDDGIV
jgi:hypothetical protein